VETRDIETQIADLRRQRGLCLLHEKKFGDDSKIAELERLLEVQEDIAAAKAAQACEQAAKQNEAAIKAAKIEVQDLKAASAKALSDSRNAYAAGAAAMKLHLQTEASLRKAQAKLNQLTGEKTPITNVFELEKKRSLQIAQVALKALNNHPSRFGHIEWPMSLLEWKD
jgi:hypothetical protein